MNIVLSIHSVVRWVVVVVAVIAAVRFASGWLGKLEYKRMDRGLMAGLAGLIDLQLLLGLPVLFFGPARYPTRARWGHALIMIIVVVLGHVPMRWRGSDNAQEKFRNNLVTIVVIGVLIYVGVAFVGGWQR